jgi:hypothetical protein
MDLMFNRIYRWNLLSDLYNLFKVWKLNVGTSLKQAGNQIYMFLWQSSPFGLLIHFLVHKSSHKRKT